jgi:uncharacterized protein YbbK (DUF523 family)
LKFRILVSACLIGEPVRYDGNHARRRSGVLEKWRREGRLLPVCPEVDGGLPVPRTRAEIVGGEGAGVLNGAASVLDADGRDVTEFFLTGARKALQAARDHNVRLAILKEGSPSCGSSAISDGSFSGTRKPGRGVTAALLERCGIRVLSESEMEEAAAFLADLEAS